MPFDGTLASGGFLYDIEVLEQLFATNNHYFYESLSFATGVGRGQEVKMRMV